MQKSIKSHDESLKFSLFLLTAYLWIAELKCTTTQIDRNSPKSQWRYLW